MKRAARFRALAVALIAAALTGSMTAPTRSVADEPFKAPPKGEKNSRCPDVDPEANLKALGIELPVPMPPPGINFELAAQTGNLLFLSGAGPQNPDGSFVTGKLGQDFTVEKGYEAARLTAINQLGVLKATLGDLGRVNRIVKLLGMVNAVPDFTQHPAVINGASDLLVEVFGDCGRHARSAVGMASLPFGIPVEIEMIVEAAIPPDVGQNSDASGYLLGDTIHPTTADHLAIAGAADVAVVPIPATLPLFATGLIALALAKRRCRRTKAG